MAERAISTYKWLYLLVVVIAVAILGVGLWQVIDGRGWAMLAAGSVALVAVLIAWPLMLALDALGHAALTQQQELSERLQQISIMLDTISEQQLLSDRAKSVAFREKDREALRRGIHEEIAKHDYEAALVLVTDMEAAFGYRQEADRFRREIESRRQDEVRRHVNEAVATIDRHARNENWNDALREAERVMNLYPNNEQAHTLPQEVENRRQAFKRQLMDQLREAEQRVDIDGGIAIVRKLDMYLTPAEAEAVRDSARNIFRQKLIRLGQQFTNALSDGRRDEATRVGEEIMQEYPNTRMAQEVRDKLEELRQPRSATANSAAAAAEA